MRATATENGLKVSAYAGTYVVVLAWDTVDSKAPKRADLLGYGLERTEYDVHGDVVEQYWMRGIKRFKDKDKGLPPGTPVSTAEHPIQGYQWADYTAKAGTHYRYRIVPVCGTVKKALLDESGAVSVEITAESEGQRPEDDGSGIRHDVFFNRGVIGSQAYAREFGNRNPDAANPRSKEMKWLSRGLFEALVGFIGLGKDGMGLRACLYEFHYLPVANAFVKAIEAGADVKVIYDAESDYKADNEKTIRDAGLNDYDAVIARKASEGIRHNKFIVLLDGDDPVAVWTGSTNISKGGLFGHSNVGHIVWDAGIAKDYLEYWERLSKDPTPTKLREPNRTASPTPVGKPPKGVTPLFSARDDKDRNDTLKWYAERLADAREVSCMTFAFNIDPLFQEVFEGESDVLRYIVKDDPLGATESIGKDRDVIFAAGSYLAEGAIANFLSERSNPLNRNRYIHNKFMLVDPLSNDPLVITGSANFSLPSQRINDENMLVIRGDTRVADIYFGEYMRVFDHHYARYVVRLLEEQDNLDPEAGYLKASTADWLTSHFNPKSYKSKRRRYFCSPSA